jgi:hypothetical protein
MKDSRAKVQKLNHFGRKGKVGVLEDLVSWVPTF